MIAMPLKPLTPRITRGVSRDLNDPAASTSTHHHAAEPSSTPSTTDAGRPHQPPMPRPSVAASAAKETIVAGLVTVSPTVET